MYLSAVLFPEWLKTGRGESSEQLLENTQGVQILSKETVTNASFTSAVKATPTFYSSPWMLSVLLKLHFKCLKLLFKYSRPKTREGSSGTKTNNFYSNSIFKFLFSNLHLRLRYSTCKAKPRETLA